MVAFTWITLLAGVACVSGLGQQISIQEYPYVAQVEYAVGVTWLQQCVGTILTSYHVMSAASCFTGQGARRIRAGSSTRGTGGQVTEVYNNYNHPSYGLYPSLGQDGDLTILRLATGLTLGANVQQASILGQGINLPEGLIFSLASWGSTTEGTLITDNDLYKLTLVNINNDQCMEKYLLDGETITENMICGGLTQTSGRDLDSRDAGAGFFYQDVVGTTTVVGVVSFGKSNGADEYPIVATAVASYTSWIVETASTV